MAGGHLHALHVPGDTPIHRASAEIKIAATVCFVLAVVATPREAFWAFAAYAVILAVLVAVARIPAVLVARRTVIEVPFLLFALFIPFVAGGPQVEVLGMSLSEQGLLQSWNILAKGTLGVVASVVLASTTDVRELIVGMERLRVPAAFVSIVSFMVRYSDVVTAEANRMRIARVSRGYDPRAFWHAKALAQSVGSLFVRSYERGERVYLAMVSRGWTGSMPPLGGPSATAAQWVAGMSVPALAACVMTTAWLTL